MARAMSYQVQNVAMQLEKVGLLPPNTSQNVINVEVLMPQAGVVVLRYDVALTADDLAKVAIVLGAFAESLDRERQS